MNTKIDLPEMNAESPYLKSPFLVKNQKLLNYLLNFMLSFAFACSIAFTLSLSFDATTSLLLGFCVIAAVYILLTGMYINKYTRRISLLLLIMGIAGGGTYLYLNFSYFSKWYEEFSAWLYEYAVGYVPFSHYYGVLVLIGIYVVTALFSYVLTVRNFNFILAITGGGIVFVLQWLSKYFVSYTCFFVFLFSVYILYFKDVYLTRLSYYNRLEKKAQKAEMQEAFPSHGILKRFLKTKKKLPIKPVKSYDFAPMWSFLVCLIPVALVITLIGARLPYSEDAIKIPWLDKQVRNAFDYIDYLSRRYTEYEYFSVANTGFGESGWLGGNVNLDKTKVLSVRSSVAGQYLRGSSKDYYDGNKWINTSPLTHVNGFTLEKGKEYDLLEYDMLNWGVMALGGGRESFLRNFRRTDGVVTFLRLKTKTIFTPLNTTKLTFPTYYNSSSYFDHNMVFSSEANNSDGFTYNYTAYTLYNLDSETENILNRAGKGVFSWLEANPMYDINLEFEYVDTNTPASGDESSPNPDAILDQSIINVGNRFIKLLGITDSEGNPVSYVYKDGELKFFHGPILIVMKNLNITIPENSDTITVAYISQTGEDVTFSRSIDEMLLTDFKTNTMKLSLNYYAQRHYDTFSELKAYAEAMGPYLQIPDTLPQRVKDLALEITKGADTEYKKIKAIEKYLSENFRYTLRPGIVPKENDFVDYFLFEKKSGYCTYYASAMVILLRCVDIPARYVEGFALPEKHGNASTYTITNERAHAWPEVFLEGLGWLIFEPTPPYNEPLYERIIPKGNTGIGGNEGVGLPPITPPPGTAENGIITPVDKTDWSLLETFFYISGAVVASSLLLLLLIVFINIIRIRMFMSKLERISPKRSIKRLYHFILKLYEMMEEPIMYYETPLEFCNRLYAGEKSLILQHAGANNLYSATDCFMATVYGGKDMTPTDLHKMLAFFEKTLERTKYSLGYGKYFLYRYILGKI